MEGLPLMTYATALAIERWPEAGNTVLIPRARLEVDGGVEAGG